MWSLGVISYILLAGYAPFAAPNQTDLFRAIVAGRFQFDSPYWDRVSPEAKDLIRRLLVVDPSRRITAREVLSHRWLQGTVSSVELSSTLAQMRLFQASRKQVIRRGALRKVGHFVRSTKQRLFVLTSDALEYYDSIAAPAGSAGAAPGNGGGQTSGGDGSASAVGRSSGGNEEEVGRARAGTAAASVNGPSFPPSLLTSGRGDGGSGGDAAGPPSLRSASSRGGPTGLADDDGVSEAGSFATAATTTTAGGGGAGGQGGFPALLGLFGLGPAAAGMKLKGSIPIRDIRGVTATDAAGKDLPPQRVVSVSTAAVTLPSHYAASATAVASAAASAAAASGGSTPGASPFAAGSSSSSTEATADAAFGAAGGDAGDSAAPPGARATRSGSSGAALAPVAGPGSASTAERPLYWFKIASTSGRDYLLAADSETARGEWIRAIAFILQRSDLMRKAQVAMAGERVAEAVALMKLAQDWSTLMVLPDSGGGGGAGKGAPGGLAGGRSAAGFGLGALGAGGGSSVSGSSTASSSGTASSGRRGVGAFAGGSGAGGGSGPGSLASSISSVALRTHDPLSQDWGKSTRILSKVTAHKAALQAAKAAGGGGGASLAAGPAGVQGALPGSVAGAAGGSQARGAGPTGASRPVSGSHPATAPGSAATSPQASSARPPAAAHAAAAPAPAPAAAVPLGPAPPPHPAPPGPPAGAPPAPPPWTPPGPPAGAPPTAGAANARLGAVGRGASIPAKAMALLGIGEAQLPSTGGAAAAPPAPLAAGGAPPPGPTPAPALGLQQPGRPAVGPGGVPIVLARAGTCGDEGEALS
jgi:hypothetical protein